MDRRVLLAVALMMAILVLPTMLLKPKPGARRLPAPAESTTVGPQPAAAPAPASAADTVTGAAAGPEDTVVVSSQLYRYGFSTRGGRLVQASFLHYRSMRPDEPGLAAQILPPASGLLGLGLLVGRDTVWLRDWQFTPSRQAVSVTEPSALTFTARQGGVTVTVNYRFRPDDYLVDVDGRVEGLDPDGATLLVGMGPGLRNTESDSLEHLRELGLVVKDSKASLTRFSRLKPQQPVAFNGPFEWVAIKSKYFVTAILALDTTGSGRNGRIGGAGALAQAGTGRTTSAASISAGIPVPGSGAFSFQLYAGPMEYPRLRAIGHDFDDINPYGWPGFRTIIRPVALGARSLLVWMHDSLGLAYGFGLVLFGILIRVLLWPLNQKAMRSTMAMQAVQPLMKELQEKHKSDPQKLQQEMFKLYKEHNVNPFGGCWPMLLPWPVLLALFFVFQNTIELRGASFLWLPDLSRPDPVYVIPIVMGISMFVLSYIGQRGMPPNPQTKMMLYLMPGMMTFLFLRFASGLNLYYTVMNLASLPQQWLLARERQRRNLPAPPPPASAKPARR